MKLKIVSDGTDQGTRIIDARTGERLVGVSRVLVRWRPGRDPRCFLVLYGIEIDMLADLPDERREHDGQTR